MTQARAHTEVRELMEQMMTREATEMPPLERGDPPAAVPFSERGDPPEAEEAHEPGAQQEITREDALYEKYREPISRLTLMDDIFMTKVFDGNVRAAGYVLRTILNKPDLKVTSVTAQKVLKNLTGRSVRLDVLAEDSRGLKYNIEVQKSEQGAHPKRARYYSAMIDSTLLAAGAKGFKMPESYVVFITESDVLKGEAPLYHIERIVLEKRQYFRDGEHIIYVNGECGDTTTAVGRLMHDFHAQKAEEMYSPELAESVRIYKESKEEVTEMSGVIEELIEKAEESALKKDSVDRIAGMLRRNKTPQEIHDFCDYPMELIEEVKRELQTKEN